MVGDVHCSAMFVEAKAVGGAAEPEMKLSFCSNFKHDLAEGNHPHSVPLRPWPPASTTLHHQALFPGPSHLLLLLPPMLPKSWCEVGRVAVVEMAALAVTYTGNFTPKLLYE